MSDIRSGHTAIVLGLVLLVSCESSTEVMPGPEARRVPTSSDAYKAIRSCGALTIPKDGRLTRKIDLKRRTITFRFMHRGDEPARTTIRFDEPACRTNPLAYDLITTVLDDHLEVIFERRVARCMGLKGHPYIAAPSARFGYWERPGRALERLNKEGANQKYRESLSPDSRREYDLALHGVEDANDESAYSAGGCFGEVNRITPTTREVLKP